MTKWFYTGSNKDFMEFVNCESLLRAIVHKNGSEIDLVSDSNTFSVVSGDSISIFLFDSGLGDAIRRTQTRLKAEKILTTVVAKLHGLPQNANRNDFEDVIRLLIYLNTVDAYYSDYLVNELGCDKLYQSKSGGDLYWVYTPQHNTAGSLRVSVKCTQ